MRQHALYLIVPLLTLLGCSSHPGETTIRGTLEQIEQGEFYLYCSEGGHGRLDTLRVRDGEFSYSTPLEGSAIMHILYPNRSQTTLFVHAGDKIRLKGNAQHLQAVEVSGNEDNKAYTAFRLSILGQPEKEVTRLAADFITQHPTLLSSRYLFTTYFLDGLHGDAALVNKLFTTLHEANPRDINLAQQRSLVAIRGKLLPGQPLPPFKLTVTPGLGETSPTDTLTQASLKGEHALIFFWAGWKGGSRSAIFQARRFRRQMAAKGKSVRLLSVSLDTDEPYLRDIERHDSIDFPSHCSFQVFHTPFVRKYGVRDLPYFILVDPEGKIIATGHQWAEDIQPSAQKLCS